MPMINSRVAAALLNVKAFPGSSIYALSCAGASMSSHSSKGANGDGSDPYDNDTFIREAESEPRNESLREKTLDSADKMADRTRDWVKQGADRGKETAEDWTETAKTAAKRAWETVMGKSYDEDDMGIEDHVNKPAQDEKEKVMDQHVVDERRRRVEDKDQNKY